MKDKPLALLIQPPVYDYAFYDLFARPYGLLKVGRWLEEAGWSIAFVDALDCRDPISIADAGMPARKSDGTGKLWRQPLPPSPASRLIRRRYCRYGIVPESFERRLRESCPRTPDLVCVGTGMTYWYEGVKEAISRAKLFFPGVPAVAGGVYASLLPEHCTIVSGADFAVKGEAWPSLALFLESLSLPAPSSPPREAVLPIRGAWEDAGVLRLNRGCPFNCDYCASRLLCSAFAEGDPWEAFAHVLELHRNCGTVNFAFLDDALLVAKDRVLFPFLERVVSSGLPLAFHTPNAVHVRYIDSDTARLMRRAGFQEIRLGFESSSADFHERHGRKYADGEFVSAVEHLLEAGFRDSSLSVYLLAGLPGQEAGEVEESVRYVQSAGVRVHIAEYSPVPGTAFWEESVRRCRFPLEEEPLYHNNTFFPMEWEGFTRDDLERIKRLAKGVR